MKWGKIFWAVLILIVVNVILLALDRAKNVQKFIEGVQNTPGIIWGESAVLAFLGAIPGLNYFVMILMIPIVFFNAWTKLPQIQMFAPSSLQEINKDPSVKIHSGGR